MEEEVDWRLMIPELLSLILDKLPLVTDYLHFSVVCKSWYDVAQSKNSQRVFLEKTSPSHAQRQPPLLLILPPREGGKSNKRNHHHRHHLFSIPKNKILDFQVSQSVMPSNSQVRCCGSSHGWLFFHSKNCFTMSNPFTGKIIQLPPIRYGMNTDDDRFLKFEGGEEEEPKFYSEHVRKVVLSSNPDLNPNDYEAAAIYSNLYCLAIFKAGDENWTFVKFDENLDIFGFLDVIYYKGAFHVIHLFMGLWKLTISGTSFAWSYKFDVVARPRLPLQLSDEEVEYFGRSRYTYVVESSKGDLLCALRVFDTIEGEDGSSRLGTTNFRILKLVNDNAIENNNKLWILKEWTEIDNLLEDALFLGDNYSIAINVREIAGYQKNTIYYTDNKDIKHYIHHPSHGCGDIGIFNLENRSFGSHYAMHSSPVPMPQTIWIVPSLVIPEGGKKADHNDLTSLNRSWRYAQSSVCFLSIFAFIFSSLLVVKINNRSKGNK